MIDVYKHKCDLLIKSSVNCHCRPWLSRQGTHSSLHIGRHPFVNLERKDNAYSLHDYYLVYVVTYQVLCCLHVMLARRSCNDTRLRGFQTLYVLILIFYKEKKSFDAGYFSAFSPSTKLPTIYQYEFSIQTSSFNGSILNWYYATCAWLKWYSNRHNNL